jgi:hypothetical protein
MKNTIDTEDINRSTIQQLLSDQYQVTEEYCNATTALHNTILDQQQQPSRNNFDLDTTYPVNQTTTGTTMNPTDRSFHLRTSIDRYQHALTNLQNIVVHLEQLVVSVEEKKQHLVQSASLVHSNINKNDNDMLLSSSVSYLRLLNLPILQDHLCCTYRILRTIYTMGEGTSYYTNGIAIPSSTIQHGKNINIKLVALATLRASIQIVKESLP